LAVTFFAVAFLGLAFLELAFLELVFLGLVFIADVSDLVLDTFFCLVDKVMLLIIVYDALFNAYYEPVSPLTQTKTDSRNENLRNQPSRKHHKESTEEVREKPQQQNSSLLPLFDNAFARLRPGKATRPYDIMNRYDMIKLYVKKNE
jgi:hypothetical protein